MLLQAKSHLARLMATENLVVEERNVETAYFDINSRVLIVPILNGNLSPYLYDLLLGHEVGHALETPAAGWHDSIVDLKVDKSIINVCEDARIEKKIKRKFPGLKHSFNKGYSELMEMDFFGIKNRNLNELNFIDRVNLHTKIGSALQIVFNDEEKVLLNEVETTETFDEVVIVAKKIQNMMLKEIESKRKTKKRSDKTKNEESEQFFESENFENLNFETEEQEVEELEKEDKEEVEDIEKFDNGGSNIRDNDSISEQNLSSETDKNFREKEKNLYDKGNTKKDIIYSDIPKMYYEKIIVSYTDIIQEFQKENKSFGYYNPQKIKENFIKFKNDSNKVVSYLVKEFEMRKNANQQSRVKISKTGIINMNKIHEYLFTDDIFARMANVPNGKSHGLVMFIDWSGSMADKIESTIRQLLNLVLFCKKVNIPFEVYAFSTEWKKGFIFDETEKNDKIQKPAIGELKIDKDFHLMNILSHKMKTKEFSDMAGFLLDYTYKTFGQLTGNMIIPPKLKLGQTPLNQTIVCAFEIIPDFKKNNKLQIVNSVFLTDGESNVISERFSFAEYQSKKFVSYQEVRPNNSRRSVLRDPITKATVEMVTTSEYWNFSSIQTIALLELLKQRTECNLIGFFIGSFRDIKNTFSLYSKRNSKNDFDLYIEREMNKFKKDKHLTIENVGYDEYYLINSNSMEIDDKELVISENSTVRGIASAFSKYTGGKVNSRIILNRFIKLVT